MNPKNKFGSHKGWFKEHKRHSLARQGIKTAKTTTERRMDFIKGGLADNIPASAFDSEQLKKGMKVEMEHTNNPKIAEEIARDHLTEDKEYYKKLEKMEKLPKLVKSGYVDGEWADEFYQWDFEVDGNEVQVSRSTIKKGDWRVVWDGAVDFDGNKADLLKRYPEFKEFVK